MRFFDSHCHLENEKFNDDIAQVLDNMHNAGVDKCICAGSDMLTSEQIVNLAEKHKEIYATVAVHPHEAKHFKDEDLKTISEWLKLKKVVGIGEIGLDYYYDFSDRDTQKKVFKKQIELGIEMNVPIMLHIREAHGDTMEILKYYGKRLKKCVFHCYSGSAEMAKEYVKMGFYISFAGPITFKNASNLIEVPKVVPDDMYFIETDSPYLAPVPYRGKRNEPALVVEIAKKIAEIKGIPLEKVAEKSYENVCRFYDISE